MIKESDQMRADMDSATLVLFKLQCSHELPGDLVNADSGSESLRWGLRFCIFNMLSGEAAAAGLWLPLGVKLYVVPLCHHLLKFPHSHSHWFPSWTLQSKMMWGS